MLSYTHKRTHRKPTVRKKNIVMYTRKDKNKNSNKPTNKLIKLTTKACPNKSMINCSLGSRFHFKQFPQVDIQATVCL